MPHVVCMLMNRRARDMGARLCATTSVQFKNPDVAEIVQMRCDSDRLQFAAWLFCPSRGSWAAPLPDLSRPAINHRIRIGEHVFRIAISDVQREVPREPDTHLVQIGIFYGEQPLAAARSRACAQPTRAPTSGRT